MTVAASALPPLPEAEIVERISAHHLDATKLSIVVFGPGEGEGIVVLLPDGRLGVVDGCAESDDKGAGDPVLELVRELADGADARRIAFACLTHPHSDHFRGLGRIVERYKGRIDHVCLVDVVIERNREAIVEWIRLEEDEECHRSIDRLYTALYDVAAGAPCDLSQGMEVMPASRADGARLSVRALGPSRHARRSAHVSLIDWAVARSTPDSPMVKVDPNGMSGALLIEWGEAGVLLAGDLLRDGWISAREWVQRRIQVVNVAHHASEEAHDDTLWATLKPDIAIVTPFKNANQNLKRYPPTPDDIKRLAIAPCKVAITSPPQWLGMSATHPKASRADVVARVAPAKAPGRASPIGGANAKRNAVAVTLNHHGVIERIVFGGHAAWYA